MSSITFDANLNVDKLEAEVKRSNQTISNWAGNVEKAGGVADAGLNKMTKSFKDAITEQKALIKSIEADIKTLQTAYDNAASGKVKSAIGGDLGSAKRALKEEQAGLLDMQKQQIEANKAEAGSADGIISKLKGWALGLFSVAAAMKIGKAIIASTNETTIAFEKITGAASAAVGYFFRAIASGNWSNFSSGMDRAIRGATEYVEAMANLRNEENAQKIKSSEEDLKIAELRDKTYDKDKKNTGDRLGALQQIIELQKEKYTQEAALAKSAYDINLKKAASDSGLSEKQIANFLKEYKSLEDLIKVGKQYNEITNLMRKPGMNAAYVADLLKERNALAGNAAEAGAYVTAIGKVTPEVRKQLSDAAASANEAAAAFGQKNRRDKMQAAAAWNELWDAWMAEIDAQNKVWEERNDIGKKIADQEKLLNDAIAEGSDAEIKAVSLRIGVLQEELKIREKLNKAIVDAMAFQGFVPTQVSSGTISVPTVFPAIKKPAGSKTPEQINQEMVNLRPLGPEWEDNIKKQEKTNKDEEAALKKQLALREEIFQAVTDLSMQLAKQAGLNDEAAQAIGTTIDAIGKLESDPIGAAATALSEIISLFPSQAEKFAVQMSLINEAIKEAQRLVDVSERLGGGEVARQSVVDAAKAKKTADEVALQKAIDKKNDKIFAFGPVYEADKKAVIELTAAVAEDQAAIEDAQNALTDFLTATNEMNIADAISQGFQDGKKSASDFADTFNGFITGAINNALENALMPDVEAWYQQFAADMKSDGGLSPEEIAAEKIAWDAIIAKGKANRDAAYAAAGISPTIGTAAQPGLTGIVRNMSEDTGNELSGLIRSQRDDIRQVRDYTKLGINHLVGIEANTYNTVLELQKLNGKTDTVISKLGSPYTSPLG